MKRSLVFASLLALAGLAHAGRTVYSAPLVDGDVTYDRTYDVDIAAMGVDQLSFQADYAAGSFSSKTFDDGRVSTNTLTVSTSSLASLNGAAATNTLTFSSNSTYARAQATNTLNVASNTWAAIGNAVVTLNGVTLTHPQDWGIADVSSNTAVNIKNAINLKVGGFSATASGSTVTITAALYGTAGNAYTLVTSTPAALVAGGATFSGGQNNATFTLNSRIFTAGSDWTVLDVASNTAVGVKNLINAQFTAVTAATTSATVVTLTAAAEGTPGNAYTLASSTGTLAVGGATFSGGAYPAYVTINGTTLTEGVDWTAVLTATGTAKAISDAIMANSTLNAVIASTWTSGGVVYATSTAVGTAQNFAVATNQPSILVWGNSQFTGGLDSDLTLNSATISVPGHGFPTGLRVLYSTGVVALGGLANQTTYYVYAPTADTLQLSATSTGAVAGVGIPITSSSTTGPHTYTLAPLATAGTPSFKWQASNTGATFSDISVSSVTFSSPYTAASTTWDFGAYNFKWLRLKVVAPTAGSLDLTVTPLGRKDSLLP